jgi:hypothetical protein
MEAYRHSPDQAIDTDAITREYEQYTEGFSLKMLYESWVHDTSMSPALRTHITRTLTRPASNEAFATYPYPEGCDESMKSFHVVLRFGNRDAGWPGMSRFTDEVRQKQRLRDDLLEGVSFWLTQQEVALSSEQLVPYWDITDLLLEIESPERLAPLLEHHPLNPSHPTWFEETGGASRASSWLLGINDWTKHIAYEQIVAKAEHESKNPGPQPALSMIKNIMIWTAIEMGSSEALSLDPPEITEFTRLLEATLPAGEQYAMTGSIEKMRGMFVDDLVERAYFRRHTRV